MSRIGRLAAEQYFVVPLGAVLALVWANVQPDSYFTFARWAFFPVNDIGMALFFALVTQEIVETAMPGGVFSSWRHRMLPMMAAAGGFIVSVLVYLAFLDYVDEPMLPQAWPSAAAIDVVFSYFLARLIFTGRTGVAFTLLLAVTTDIVVLAFIAVRYPSGHDYPTGPILIAVAILAAFLLRRRGVRGPWPYLLVCGPVCWWGFLQTGLQPALALIPIVPFVPHTPRDLNLFDDGPKSVHDAASHLEHILKYPAQVVRFFFAVVNSGVVFNYFEPGTWALPLAALVGRPVGILAGAGLALACGFLMPQHFRWRDLIVVALIASTGFAFALFVATSIFPVGDLLTQAKMGALMTVFGTVLAFGGAALLRVGRFAHRT